MLYVGTLILVSRWVSQPLQPTTSTYKGKTHRLRTVISDVSLRLHRTLGRTAEGAGTSPLFCPGIGSFCHARKRLGKAGDARTASEVSAEGWGLPLLVISSLIMMGIVLVVMQ